MPTDQVARAGELRRLHLDPEILVVLNVWDAASARTAAAVPGARALATASWAIAAAHGAPDGEELDRDTMLAAVRRIAAAVELPVSADLESGYGETPDEVADTIREAIAAGAVGCNIEDSLHGDASGLRPLGDAAARVAAVRDAAGATGVPFVINARTDVLLHGGDLEDALHRGRAYAEAGADCIFVLGVRGRANLRRLVDEMGAPVSILASPGAPPIRELQEIGIARVSFGPGLMGAALANMGRVAGELLGGGEVPGDMGFRPPAA